MRRPVTNQAASVLDRLRGLARERGQPFDLVLVRYVLERFLWRLSQSEFRDRFVLKGAVLMTAWFANPFRPTRDLDLLGFGDGAPDALLGMFCAVCAMAANDGVTFDGDALTVQPIREQTDYGGLRLETTAHLGSTRVKLSVDVAFGDATEQAPTEIELPVLLDAPAPRIRGYARETVIAEKLQAVVILGRANTRMKDYYDLWMLARSAAYSEDALARAISATFVRRQTDIPQDIPDGLSAAFADDPAKRRQWESFAANIRAETPAFGALLAELRDFLLPHMARSRTIA